MIRNVLASLAVVLGMAAGAFAQSTDQKGMYLLVDIAKGGDVFIVNGTSDSQPYWFDGYEIACETNCIDPAAFRAIGDLPGAEERALLGDDSALSKSDPQSNTVAEVALSFSKLPAGARIKIGTNLLNGTKTQLEQLRDEGKLKFSINGYFGSNQTNVFVDRAPITVTPEPSTFALAGLAVAGLALVVRRRK